MRSSYSRARAQSLATVLVLESLNATFTNHFDYDHRFAEHEHEKFRTFHNCARLHGLFPVA
jgi:hypothetical protein